MLYYLGCGTHFGGQPLAQLGQKMKVGTAEGFAQSVGRPVHD